MRKLALVLGTLAAGVFLTACPPTYPACQNDTHCQEQNEVCVQGQCRQCATDAHCQEGFVCRENRCEPRPECDPQNPCPAGRECRAGKCVLPEGGCVRDADCRDDQTCEANRCVARAAGTCAVDAHCGVNERCEANRCVAAGCEFAPVYFGFNMHSLEGDVQQRLADLAACIRRENRTVVLEGHADERGTEEYNLQLSNRRAASVRRYLIDLGVPARLLETVGYGENRPAQRGTSEEAYAANRRVEFRQ